MLQIGAEDVQVFVATELASHTPRSAVGGGLPLTAYVAFVLVVSVIILGCHVAARCTRRHKCASCIVFTILAYCILHKYMPLIIGLCVMLFGDRNFSFENIT